MPPDRIGLYIHLPWCVQKCPYCDFNSHALKLDLPEAAYVEAIIADLEFEAAQLQDRTIQSIFFGGGTPSLFSGSAIGNILDAVTQHFRLAADAEITLEANPGTVEASNFKIYHEAGINRLSLGLQSLNDGMLQRLGRIHNAAESLQAFDIARQAGFDNINLDLMFGLPEQDMAQGLDDLTAVISLNPEHVSWYQLTLEPNTQFASCPPTLPNDDSCDELHTAGIEMLSMNGYGRYEVSAYAQTGRECRHNLNYWQFGDYLGIGAGAHGKITHERPVRSARFKHPADYMEKAGTVNVCELTNPIEPNELLMEYLLNQLRLVAGFSLEAMQQYIGIGVSELKQTLEKPIKQGLISLDSRTCRATAKGFRYLDEILITCLPDEAS